MTLDHDSDDVDLDEGFDDEEDLEDSLEAELKQALLSEGPAEGSSVLVTSSVLGRVVDGKYKIDEQLGRGGMGQVFLATHVETGGTVVVKVMRKMGDAQAFKRFQIEAKNAAALQHPNTIRVTDYGDDEGMPFLIMEYVQGRDLTALIKEGPMPWRRAAHIASQILSALWAAHHHERKIIHRDIKPGNILVTSQPGFDDFVKVLDFGISRALEATGAGTEGIVGTPFTVAPEQWTGAPISPQTDLYSLGCTVYEMLCGNPPFTGASLVAIGQGHMEEPPPPLPEAVDDAVPELLRAWVWWLLEKDPADRPGSAAIALKSLKAILHNPHGGADLLKDPDAIQKAPRPERRHTTTAEVAPIKAPDDAPTPAREPLPVLWIVVAALVLVAIAVAVAVVLGGG